MNYENRVTAFIDLLGFKDLLSKTIDNKNNDVPEEIDKIYEAYRSIREVWNLDEKDSTRGKRVPKDSKMITTFSDCLVISFRTEEESGVFYTLLELKWMIMRLIYKGILCRGAITHGKLIHTPEVLFGPALAEAYLLESKAALYPRVILHKDIIDIGKMNRVNRHSSDKEREYVESLLEKDTDGMYYIDYFIKAAEELDDPLYDFPEYLNALGGHIRKGLMGSSSIYKSDIKVKYRWMKERYNQTIEKVQDQHFIKHLRNSEEYEMIQIFEGMKKINPYA